MMRSGHSSLFLEMRNNKLPAVFNNAQTFPPPGRPTRLLVSETDRQRLGTLLSAGKLRPAHARRLRVIVLTAQGLGSEEIARRVGLSRFHVSRVRARFARGGVASLADQPRRGRPGSISVDLAQRIAVAALGPPPPGASRWTLALVAQAFGLSRSIVYRVLCSRGVTLGPSDAPARRPRLKS